MKFLRYTNMNGQICAIKIDLIETLSPTSLGTNINLSNGTTLMASETVKELLMYIET